MPAPRQSAAVEGAPPIRCPQCCRFSPPDTARCDCGYDFANPIAIDPAAPQGFTFFPVATHKFIVLSLCTFSLYEVYWFYQQWKRIRESTGQRLSPVWRAVFGLVWVIPLLGQIRQRAEAGGVAVAWSAGALGAAFIALSVLWRLPDPWWLVTYGSLLALLPVVRTCEAINARAQNPEGLNSRYTAWNVVGIVIGGLLFALMLVGVFLPEQASDFEAAL